MGKLTCLRPDCPDDGEFKLTWHADPTVQDHPPVPEYYCRAHAIIAILDYLHEGVGPVLLEHIDQ